MADDFDRSEFRVNFPEFASETTYPNSMIDFWANVADKLLTETRWDDLREVGMELLVAHYVILASMNKKASENPKLTPGTTITGVVSAQSAGPVSVSLDTQNAIEKDAGQYNLTTYGRQFWGLVQIVGAGGYFV